MGRTIIKHTVNGQDRFLIWSSIVDAPVVYAINSLQELKDHYREELGREGLSRLEWRIANELDWARSVESVVSCNRAGKDGTQLTAEQIIAFYFVQQDHESDAEPPLGTRPTDDDEE